MLPLHDIFDIVQDICSNYSGNVLFSTFHVCGIIHDQETHAFECIVKLHHIYLKVAAEILTYGATSTSFFSARKCSLKHDSVIVETCAPVSSRHRVFTFPSCAIISGQLILYGFV